MTEVIITGGCLYNESCSTRAMLSSDFTWTLCSHHIDLWVYVLLLYSLFLLTMAECSTFLLPEGTSGRQAPEANPTGRRNFYVLCQAWDWSSLRTGRYKVKVSLTMSFFISPNQNIESLGRWNRNSLVSGHLWGPGSFNTWEVKMEFADKKIPGSEWCTLLTSWKHRKN